MNNFEHAQEATATALGSAGSATRENAKYMESLNAKTAQLKNTFQDLANNVIQSELIANMLDLANAFLTLVNTPVGTFVTQVVLLTTAGWSFVKLMQAMGIVKAVIANFQAFPLALQAITSAFKGTAAASVAFSATLHAALPIIGALVAGGILLAKVYDATTVSLEEQKEIVQNLQGELSTLNSEYETLSSQTDLTEADETRLKILEKQIEANKILLKQEAEKQYYMQFGEGSEQKLSAQGTSGYTSGVATATTGMAYGAALQGAPISQDTTTISTGIERFEENIQTFERLQQSIKTIEQEMANLDTSTVDGALRMEELRSSYESLTSQSSELHDSMATTVEELLSMKEAMGGLPPEAQAVLEKYLDMEEGFVVANGGAQALSESGKDLSNSIKSLSESATDAANQLSSLDDAYSTLTSAVEEYNSNGYISADTLSKLLELGDEYISMLSFENGQLVFNSDAFNENSQQIRQNAIEAAKETAAKKLMAIAQNSVNTEIANSSSVASGASGAMWAYKQALDGVASGAWDASFGVEYLMNAMRGIGVKGFSLTSSQQSAMQSVLADYQNFVNLINSTSLVSPSGGGGTRGSSGGGTGTATDPIEEQSKAFKEQIAILEHELKIMEKMGASEEERIAKSKEIQEAIKNQEAWYRAQGLDDNSEYLRELEEQWWDYQESIKDIYKEILQSQLKDLQSQQSAYETLFNRITEAADKQIEALEEQRDAEEAYWDEKIEALEKQNEELDKQIEREELLDNLAKARQKQVLVYKDGRFQYISDIDEVSLAQEALEEYEREQALEEQTAALEEQKDQALAALDEQIQGWETYKEKWSSIVDEIDSIQDALIIEQQLNIKLEGNTWTERLTNLGVFVNGYISKEGNFVDDSINKNGELLRNQYLQVGEEAAILEQRLENFDDYIDNIVNGQNELIDAQKNFVKQQQNLAGQSSKAWGDSLSSFNDYVNDYKNLADKLNGIQVKPPSANTSGVAGTGGGMGHFNPAFSTSVAYATGTTNARGGISLVGEQGPEMRVLNSGDGILPADITKNLWSWGMTTPSAMLSTLSGGIDAFGQKIQIVIDKFAPNLPNVQNGEDFANYLKNNFWRAVIQY